MSLTTGSKCLSWYLDSGCSWHMTGERCMFQSLTPYHGGTVTFKGNQKGKIIWVGKIGIHPYPSTDNALFVEGLRHNLLSISQFCDNGYECIILNKDGSLLFSTKRISNLFKIKLGELPNKKVSWLLSTKENHWMWHKKLGHASLRLISKL